MRWSVTAALSILLAACGSSLPKCPPGVELVSTGSGWVCSVAPDGGLVTGSATTTILSAPCVTPEDGGVPRADFQLPASFQPGRGDTLAASICSSMCGDAGTVCAQLMNDADLSNPIPGSTVTVYCNGEIGGHASCAVTSAFLQILE